MKKIKRAWVLEQGASASTSAGTWKKPSATYRAAASRRKVRSSMVRSSVIKILRRAGVVVGGAGQADKRTARADVKHESRAVVDGEDRTEVREAASNGSAGQRTEAQASHIRSSETRSRRAGRSPVVPSSIAAAQSRRTTGVGAGSRSVEKSGKAWCEARGDVEKQVNREIGSCRYRCVKVKS